MVGITTVANKMTPQSIRALCKKNDLYLNPSLNDVLYLHFQGFDEIACLEDYTQLKCLWLESNAIARIQGLEKQRHLKCLFLQNNLIRRIENLSNCSLLDTLNLSHNQIRFVENCHSAALPALTSLDLSHNHLKTADDLTDLQRCDSVSVLDVSHNRIDDVLVVKVLGKMSSLRVLTLTGNPVISMIPNYRKTMILECKSLTYLDNRPVSERDRACAEAWKRGGFAAEREEQDRWIRAAQRKTKEDINRLLQKRNDRGHQPPFRMINLDSDDDVEFTSVESDPVENVPNGAQAENKTEVIPQIRPTTTELLHHQQEECFVDNLQSWRNVETILANPESYQTKSSEYLSQFTMPANNSESAGAALVENGLSAAHSPESLQDPTSNRELSAKNGKAELIPKQDEHESPSSQILPDKQEDEEIAEAPLSSTSQLEELQPQEFPTLEEIPTQVVESPTPFFPSFMSVTYPNPSTNQFDASRMPIDVAPKYAALAVSETRRTKDCPEVEPLFVDQPLARIAIDYEAMRHMPSELDQVIEECEAELAAAEEESMRGYGEYVKEVDRIYEEAIAAKEREKSAARDEVLPSTSKASIEEWLRSKEEGEKEAAEGAVARKVPQDKPEEMESLGGQDDSKLFSGFRKKSPESESPDKEEKPNFQEDPDKLREINNQEHSQFPSALDALKLNPNFIALKYPFTNRPLTPEVGPAEQSKSNWDFSYRGNDDDSSSSSSSWIRDYLNDLENSRDMLELAEMYPHRSREQLTEIRKENERIVASIKRLYEHEDKSEISQMRRNLGAVKKVLMDSRAAITEQRLSVQLPTGDNGGEEVEEGDEGNHNNQQLSPFTSASDCSTVSSSSSTEVEIATSVREEYFCSAKTKVDNAAEKKVDDNNKDKKSLEELREETAKDAAIEAKIKAMVEKLCQNDTPMQLKDISSSAWADFERRTFGCELKLELDGEEVEIDFSDCDSESTE